MPLTNVHELLQHWQARSRHPTFNSALPEDVQIHLPRPCQDQVSPSFQLLVHSDYHYDDDYGDDDYYYYYDDDDDYYYYARDPP